jgi:Arc/MetJ family transcription regulator
MTSSNDGVLPSPENRNPLHPLVYHRCMARTNIDIDEEACDTVMARFHLSTKREAVNFALRTIAGEVLDLQEARELRGSGWEGDLDSLRSNRQA